MALVEVFAPRNNVNDDSITVLELCVENNQRVVADQTILLAETSKAAFEVPAPVTGYVRWLVGVNDDAPNEKPLCLIADTLDELVNAPCASLSAQGSGLAYTSERGSADTAPIIDVGAPESLRDRYVTVTDWLVGNHGQVEEGQPIARLNADGRAVEILSPRAGIIALHPNLPIALGPGEPICRVGNTLAVLKEFERSHAGPQLATAEAPVCHLDPANFTRTPRAPVDQPPRFSSDAGKLLQDSKISHEQFAGRGLIRTEDVLQTMGAPPKKDTGSMRPDPTSGKTSKETTDSDWLVEGAAIREEKMSRVKRTEANLLTQTQRTVAASQTSILVQTRGIFEICRADSRISGQMASRIIFEAARLLHKYPSLNAGYRVGTIAYYEQINIGYAMDIDKGLRVPVFLNADTLPIGEIQALKQQYITKYLQGMLNIDDLSGGTFTITDLSEQGAWTFTPIINHGQSAILGIAGEQALGDAKYYPLVLTFDHRICDGRTASMFLNDLRDRLIGHEQVLLQQIDYTSQDMSETIKCSSCLRTVEQLREFGRHLVLTVDVTGRQCRICTFCLEGR